MAIKDQLNKLKENWLLILLPIALIFIVIAAMTGIQSVSRSVGSMQSAERSKGTYDLASPASAGYGYNAYGGYYPPVPSADFAPGEKDRKVVKTGSLGLEVGYGRFDTAANGIRTTITASGAYLLTDNVNAYGEGTRAYHQEVFSIKVEKSKYDSVVSQLKQLGEVRSYNENAQDITGQYVDTKVELAAEQDRLARYQAMLKDATQMQDKITLSDKIFDQQRQIEYLKQSLANQDQSVEYSSVSVTLSEKAPTFYNVAVVGFGELLELLVHSFNSLLIVIVAVLPYAAAIGIVWLIVHFARRK